VKCRAALVWGFADALRRIQLAEIEDKSSLFYENLTH